MQAAYRIIHKTIHQGQSILQSSIVAYWILSGITSTTTKVPVPFWDRYPGSGPQFVVEERVFRRDPREDVIRWRRFHGSLFKYGKATRLYRRNTQFVDDRQAAAIVRRKSQLVQVVDDWVTITTVEASKRGPLLKSRVTGDAYMYKAVLQNDLLQDPDEGVNFFKNTLKKYFLKGATSVFLIFTSKIEILLMRLKAAWMDLMPIFTAQSPTFRQSVQEANARTIARHQQAAGVRAPPPALLNEDDPIVLRQYITGMQDRQRDAFPFRG